MDWKYKHFHQERLFPAERDVVLEAARSVMAESLGWNTTDTPDGFRAEGYSFFHEAIANVQIQSATGGTRVAIELRVRRAGGAGFMLFDVGGYYNTQIGKWLDGIQWSIHQKLTGQDQTTSPPPPAPNKAAACLFNGCLGFIVVTFGLYFLINFICAVLGLITGNLYLLGRGGTLTLHGMSARIVSVLILLFVVFIAWRIKRSGNRRVTIK